MIRQNFVLGAAALAATASTLVASSSSASHEEIARNLRRPGDVNASDRAQLLRELVRYAFLNQPVEVASMSPQFAAALGLGKRRPDLVVRLGSGSTLPWSMRRPVQSVLA